MNRAICLFLFLSTLAYAVVIDEIEITVGNQAITQSQIIQDIRLASLVNGEKPDYSLDARKKSADRLIEQALIRVEMSFGSYLPVPVADLDRSYAGTEKALGGAAPLASALKAYSLTPEDLRSYLQRQLELLKFIDLRFRPAVQVTNEDVDKYYRETIVPQQGANTKAPTLNELRDTIDQAITGERVDRQLNEWIKRARTRTTVRYINPSLGVTQVPLDEATVQPH